MALKFYRVRKHEDFQHYKDRTPPWIKLHRCCLTSYRFTALTDAQKWHAVGIAILATELDNHIPGDPTWLAPRISARAKIDLAPLIEAGFLVPCECESCASTSDSKSLATGARGALAPEEERRAEESRQSRYLRVQEFDRFWKAYPKKRSKDAARRAFDKARGNGLPEIGNLVAIVSAWSKTTDWTKQGGKYVPYPATWLNQHCWDDELPMADEGEWEVVRS